VNQARRLSEDPDRLELIGMLGITPADLLQSDLILVVEGDTDAQWLRTLFPVELGRAHIMVAGSAAQVMDAHATLAATPVSVPWLCLRDRDLLTDDEVFALKEKFPNLHVWPRRAIESLVLDAELIAATVNSVMATPVATDQVGAWLEEIAEPLRLDVLSALVDARLQYDFPAPGKQKGDRFERMEAQLRRYAEVNEARADAVQSTKADQEAGLASRWGSEWPVLVDPKPVLAKLAERTSVFKSPAALISALFARARDDVSLRPAALEEFRTRISRALDSRPPVGEKKMQP